MDAQTLVAWRDVALILLVIEVFIVALVPLVLSYFAIRGLRVARARFIQHIPIGQRYVKRTEQVTRRVSNILVAPPIRVISTVQGVRTAFRTAFRHSASSSARI